MHNPGDNPCVWSGVTSPPVRPGLCPLSRSLIKMSNSELLQNVIPNPQALRRRRILNSLLLSHPCRVRHPAPRVPLSLQRGHQPRRPNQPQLDPLSCPKWLRAPRRHPRGRVQKNDRGEYECTTVWTTAGDRLWSTTPQLIPCVIHSVDRDEELMFPSACSGLSPIHRR